MARTVEYVDIIEHNIVVSKKKASKVLREQIIFHKYTDDNRCVTVGYYTMSRGPNAGWELESIKDTRVCFTFFTRSGKRRRIIGKSLTTSETHYDPELEDRKDCQERQCLFGLSGYGDVRGE